MTTKTLYLPLIDGHRGALFPWVAVFYAIGIGLYFAIPADPAVVGWSAIAAFIAGFLSIVRVVGPFWRPVVLACLLPLAGFSVAGLRSHAVSEVRLEFRYYGPIEGRVVAIDRSQSDAVRLTLDRVVLSETSPARTPARVRVSLHGDFGLPRPAPGATVGLTGHLSPPSGPVEPGGYDFRRHAWFLGLGAVGYTRNPVVTLMPPEPAWDVAIFKLRFMIGDAVRAALPGETGGFAAAITTGDRSTLDQATLEALRATNLAHLLAISGLHMGLMTGVVFSALRIFLSSIPAISLVWPVKKIAASAALAAGAVYLLLSGNNVATERAFVMVAVMLGAVLFDRRAITLRAVAVAALIVLTIRPESLVGPGFQMSFAATTALVTVYGWLREKDWSQSKWPWVLRVVGGVALSSGVAGLATAPVAAAHFNQIPHYGLLANILTVPLMGAVIMPGAVLAAVLWPFGLSWIGLLAMKPGIDWILFIAREIAAWEGALSFVHSPSTAVLPLVALSGALVAGFKGKARGLGVPVLAAAFGLWATSERPEVLISETGGQIGVLRAEGRVLSRPRGDGFAARNWLENDGDAASQADAADRNGWVLAESVRIIEIGGLRIAHGTGIRGSKAALAECGSALVVINAPLDAPRDCWLLSPDTLSESGAVALVLTADAAPILVSARKKSAGRPWSQ